MYRSNQPCAWKKCGTQTKTRLAWLDNCRDRDKPTKTSRQKFELLSRRPLRPQPYRRLPFHRLEQWKFQPGVVLKELKNIQSYFLGTTRWPRACFFVVLFLSLSRRTASGIFFPEDCSTFPEKGEGEGEREEKKNGKNQEKDGKACTGLSGWWEPGA